LFSSETRLNVNSLLPAGRRLLRGALAGFARDVLDLICLRPHNRAGWWSYIRLLRRRGRICPWWSRIGRKRRRRRRRCRWRLCSRLCSRLCTSGRWRRRGARLHVF